MYKFVYTKTAVNDLAKIDVIAKKRIKKKIEEYYTSPFDYAKKLNPKKIWMQSQVQAQGFYEKCGFMAAFKPYDLYGIKHIDRVYKK